MGGCHGGRGEGRGRVRGRADRGGGRAVARRCGGAAVSERSSSAQPRVITASPFGRWKYRNVKITRSSGTGYFLAVALTKNGYKKFMKQKSGL